MFLVAGCNLNSNQLVSRPESKTSINFLVSAEPYTNFCNGADMNSDGYKKSLTQLKTVEVAGNLNLAEKIKVSITKASNLANLMTAIQNQPDFIKIVNDTAYIAPIDAWAGVSIFLCAWKPLLETNVLQYKEIKNVIWLNDLNIWQQLNDINGKTVIFFLVSDQDKANFCQGTESTEKESQTFKETIVKQVMKLIPSGNYTSGDLIKTTLYTADAEAGLSPYPANTNDYLKIVGDIAYLKLPDGYAGLWHDLCLWQPFVEVNLLRFSEIKNIVWLNDLEKWNKLK